MQRILRLSAAIILASGARSSEAQQTTAMRVADAMMSCMTQGALAREDLLSGQKETGQALVDIMNNMTAHRSAIRRFNQCKITASQMPSGGRATDLAKTGLNVVADSLILGFQESLAQIEKILKVKTDDELIALVPEASRINDDITAAWKLYVAAAAATAHALVDDSRPSKEGTLNRLRLTKAQIAKLKTDLKEQFPDSMKSGDKHAVDAAADMLLKFLAQPYLASDEP